MTKRDIEELLKLYPVRKVHIEEIKLQLEEIELDCSVIGAISYEEKTQTSSTGAGDGEKAMAKKDKLLRELKYYTICNSRAKNLLELIHKPKAKTVVELMCFESMSATETATIIDRSIKQVHNLYNQGINIIVTKYNYKKVS